MFAPIAGLTTHIEEQIKIAHEHQTEIAGYKAFVHSIYRHSFLQHLHGLREIINKQEEISFRASDERQDISLMTPRDRKNIQDTLTKSHSPIYIITGPNSSGKTCVMELFLQIFDVLPTGDGNITGRMLLIKYAQRPEDTSICVMLGDEEGQETFLDVNSPSDCRRIIKEYIARPPEITSNWAESVVVLKLHVPILSTGIQLLDAPGFNETDESVIQLNLQSFLKNHQPYILFVYPNPTFADAETSALRRIIDAYGGLQHDAGISPMEKIPNIFFLSTHADIQKFREEPYRWRPRLADASTKFLDAYQKFFAYRRDLLLYALKKLKLEFLLREDLSNFSILSPADFRKYVDDIKYEIEGKTDAEALIVIEELTRDDVEYRCVMSIVKQFVSSFVRWFSSHEKEQLIYILKVLDLAIKLYQQGVSGRYKFDLQEQLHNLEELLLALKESIRDRISQFPQKFLSEIQSKQASIVRDISETPLDSDGTLYSLNSSRLGVDLDRLVIAAIRDIRSNLLVEELDLTLDQLNHLYATVLRRLDAIESIINLDIGHGLHHVVTALNKNSLVLVVFLIAAPFMAFGLALWALITITSFLTSLILMTYVTTELKAKLVKEKLDQFCIGKGIFSGTHPFLKFPEELEKRLYDAVETQIAGDKQRLTEYTTLLNVCNAHLSQEFAKCHTLVMACLTSLQSEKEYQRATQIGGDIGVREQYVIKAILPSDDYMDRDKQFLEPHLLSCADDNSHIIKLQGVQLVRDINGEPCRQLTRESIIEHANPCAPHNLIDVWLNDRSITIELILDRYECNLLSYLENKMPDLTMRTAVSMMLQIAIAVEYIHSFGICHRDIKCENILISLTTPDIDNGAALQFQGCPYLVLQLPSAPLSHGVFPFDLRMDIFALGVLMWEMVPRNSFQRATSVVLQDELLSHLPELTPESLKRIIQDCLEYAPQSRPTSIEVVKRLREILDVLL